MPFRSRAQMRWMFAKHPRMAERWAKETGNIKGLPARKARLKSKRKRRRKKARSTPSRKVVRRRR